jgi:hypothetical protein
MTDFELAVEYKPYLWFDKKEPFEITAVGYTVFRENKQSESFPKRKMLANWNQTAFIIEYAIWFDYDIQHMYDLEHIWVYVNKDGVIVETEGSFHGKYLRVVTPDTNQTVIEDETHINAYCQPGKHAILPEPALFRLVPDWSGSCSEYAGIEGVLIPDMYANQIHTNPEFQEVVKQYIQERFGFVPSMEYEKKIWKDSILMSWKELSDSIPNRVNAQIAIIEEAMKFG